jgi:hypothetical protein
MRNVLFPRGIRALLAVAVLAGGLAAAETSEASEVGSSRIFGVGPILGEPTGGTLKVWIGDNRFAFQAHAAITWFWVNRLAIIADVVWHPHIITDNRYFDLLWYFGVGGGAGIRAPWDDDHYYHDHNHPHGHDHDWEADPAVWIRVPFGFPFRFHKVPVEAFVEFGPSLFFVFDGDRHVFPGGFVAVGGRWYF